MNKRLEKNVLLLRRRVLGNCCSKEIFAPAGECKKWPKKKSPEDSSRSRGREHSHSRSIPSISHSLAGCRKNLGRLRRDSGEIYYTRIFRSYCELSWFKFNVSLRAIDAIVTRSGSSRNRKPSRFRTKQQPIGLSLVRFAAFKRAPTSGLLSDTV